MLKFEWKGKIDQYVKFEWKGGINKTLKFEDKVGNQSKCGNLSANHQIVQNVVFWVNSGESIKKLTFECNKVGIDKNVEIWVPNVKSIKMLKFERKRGIDQMLIFYCKSRNRSNYWNLILKFEDNVKNRSKFEIGLLITKSFKMMYCEWKVGNQKVDVCLQ